MPSEHGFRVSKIYRERKDYKKQYFFVAFSVIVSWCSTHILQSKTSKKYIQRRITDWLRSKYLKSKLIFDCNNVKAVLQMPNSKSTTNFQLKIFIFEVKASLQTLLQPFTPSDMSFKQLWCLRWFWQRKFPWNHSYLKYALSIIICLSNLFRHLNFEDPCTISKVMTLTLLEGQRTLILLKGFQMIRSPSF